MPDAGGAQVCVVDDDARVRAALASLLAAAGYRYRLFDCGAALLAWPALDAFDLAIFDVMLPDGDGFALQARVAARHPRLPVLFMSGCGEAGLASRARAAGAVAFFHKPVDPERLLATIERVLNGREPI